MKTYLLTWNPRRWHWEDLAETSADTLAGKGASADWSCGNTKRIQPGDRIFLMRVAVEPKGIISSGWVTIAPHLHVHWDADKAAAGEKCLGVDGEWERLLNPLVDAPLGLPELKKGKLADFNWTPQSSGTQIPDEIVSKCGFDFEAVYGELGRDYAQVHHLKPLADRTKPSQTKLDDLAVVCANCHAMIHRGGKCRPLDKLIP